MEVANEGLVGLRLLHDDEDEARLTTSEVVATSILVPCFKKEIIYAN